MSVTVAQAILKRLISRVRVLRSEESRWRVWQTPRLVISTKMIPKHRALYAQDDGRDGDEGGDLGPNSRKLWTAWKQGRIRKPLSVKYRFSRSLGDTGPGMEPDL